MINILFICHGNICRSPMAEFMFKKLVSDNNLSNYFYIQSAAVSNEEIGNSVYPKARKKLIEHGIDPIGKKAIKVTKSDYDKYDYIVAMENYNLIGLNKIIGNDTNNKIYLLMDFTNTPRDIDDPWYSGDFNKTYNDILEGLTGLLNYIISKETMK